MANFIFFSRDAGGVRASRHSRGRAASAATIVIPALLTLLASVLLTPLGILAEPQAGAASATLDLGGVQALYAQDLLARVNAERSARNSPSQPIPPLAVDPGLSAQAQAWSAQIAATGVISDPPLSACGPSPSAGQVCELAGNTGNSGNGYWPGDGSDGMESAYMASAGHRQNMLNAGYDVVGVGVTCSGGQAWTVEVFGFAYGNLAPAEARQAMQNSVAGVPVPPGPTVAGTQTGIPVYCPGQTVGPNGEITSSGGQYPYPYAVPAVPGEPGSSSSGAAVGIAASAGEGYWVARSDGSITAHGSAVNYGSMAGQTLAAPIRHVVGTPDGHGYWLVASDGGIFSFGDAAFYGSMGGQQLNAPVVDIAPTSSGHGYWLVATDGGVFAFGDAAFQGSMGGTSLNKPVVGMSPTPGGHGYWMVATDGGIFAFGDAAFQGSMGGTTLNKPVVGMSHTPGGHGYWMVATDGGIFAFGDASFRGSAGALPLQAPITGMAVDVVTGGYWMVATDGGVFAFGAPFEGAG